MPKIPISFRIKKEAKQDFEKRAEQENRSNQKHFDHLLKQDAKKLTKKKKSK